MELQGIIAKHESLEERSRDLIRDKLAVVLSLLHQSPDDALPPIIEPQAEIIEYVYSQGIRHNQERGSMTNDFQQLFNDRTNEFVAWLFDEMAPKIREEAAVLARNEPQGNNDLLDYFPN